MTANVGTIDRAFRLIMGLVLLAAPFVSGMALFASTSAAAVPVVAGVILVVTSAMKFCPMYRITGLRTCKP